VRCVFRCADFYRLADEFREELHQHRSEIMKKFFTLVKLSKHPTARHLHDLELSLHHHYCSSEPAAPLLPRQIALRVAFVPSSQ
jgi:hypothetical protein